MNRPETGRPGALRRGTLAGAGATAPRTRPTGGWHLIAWGCELAGTAILLLGGLSAVFLDFGAHSPVTPLLPSISARLLLTGLLFAGTGSLVAISPIGRRSGAHLNPAVTLAFFTQRKLHHHDLAGYIAAQLLGAVAACAVLRLAWGPTARGPRLGSTQPGDGLNPWQATGIEAVMTAALVLMIFFLNSHRRTARWTPLGNWILVATLVWQVAPYTGTSLNPARSIGPALLAPDTANLWVYLVGPPAGALLAAAIFSQFKDTHTLTAKLFHDVRYPSTMGSELPTTASLPSTPSDSNGVDRP